MDLNAYDPSHAHEMLDLNNHTRPDALSPARFMGWLAFLFALFAVLQP